MELDGSVGPPNACLNIFATSSVLPLYTVLPKGITYWFQVAECRLVRHQGYCKNHPLQQLFKGLIYIYFAATCIDPRWPIHVAMLRLVILARADVSEERVASIFRVQVINSVTLFVASVICSTLTVEPTRSTETSVPYPRRQHSS
jgi:hypothetical protein